MALLTSRRQRPQFKWRPQAFEVGKSKTLPAPYAGLNLRDDINALEPNEARVLENFLPTDGKVSLRPGFDWHAGGMGTGEVKTLAAFVGFTSSKMLAAANGKIYDVTTSTVEDGNNTYTKVLLKFDGADASTTITDSNAGGSAHTWAVAGNAQLDTAQFKFGISSLLCDGTGDWVTTADHADYTLGTSAFTIEMQARPAADGAVIRLAGQADATLTEAGSAWYMARNASDKLEFYLSNGTAFTTLTSTTSVVTGSFWHVRATRSSNTIYLFINGALEASAAFSGTVPDSTAALRVGAAGENTTTPWNGWVDEFTFDVGRARSTAAFTAPLLPNAPQEMAIGFTENRWRTELYNNRLFFVNGTDNPQVYDGSAVAGIVWAGSGLTDNDLTNIALVRNRLWFCENNSADVWYANVGQITAASSLTKFQLSQIAGGGICMAIGSWSQSDAGDGADDLTVFVMSTGEVIVYQGDPSTTFSLIGKYKTAPPIGRSCLVKVGGELVIITALGFLPVSAATRQEPGKALDFASVDPWGKIAPGVVADAELISASSGTSWGSAWGSAWATSSSDDDGWHGMLHKGLVYMTVPATGVSKQWVLNTRHGAWTTYTSWNGASFCSFGGDLYWGAMTGGSLYKLDGTSDNGTGITADASGAFVYPESAKTTNIYTGVRPKIATASSISALVDVNVDFTVDALSGAAVNLTSDRKWCAAAGEGASASVRLRVLAATASMDWFTTDILYKPGGIR